jgi:DNA polymerase elongation subunit (family B)
MTVMRVTDLVARNGRNWDDGPEVKIAGRTLDGERMTKRITGTRPYFFVDERVDVPENENVIRTDTGYESYDGHSLRKIVMKNPRDVGSFRDEFDQTYEADVVYSRRVSVDYGLTGYIDMPDQGIETHYSDVDTEIDEATIDPVEPRTLIADIETMPPKDGDFSEYTEDAAQPVLAICFYDTYEDDYTLIVKDDDQRADPRAIRRHLQNHWSGHEYEALYTDVDISYISCENEIDLLNCFIDEVCERQPDLISGWNWVDFDHEYLMNRMTQFDQAVQRNDLSDIGYVGGYRSAQLIDGVPAFDMMRTYCEVIIFQELRSQALDYVADQELDVGKMPDVSVGTEYRENRSRLFAYNVADTQLCVALDKKHGIHEFIYQLADLAGVQVYDV